MSSSSSVCSMKGCKKSVTCLCHHCQKNVCSKHFNEHQSQVNDELIPMADRLNELKMKIQTNEQTGPLAMLQIWQNLKKNISKYNEQISETISNIKELIDEGDASIDQVKQIERKIETLTDEVNNFMSSESTITQRESNLLGTVINMGSIQYLVKAKIKCNAKDLYGLESTRALTGYNGLCPECGKAHVLFEKYRGFYALCNTLHARIHSENGKES
ncbi:unnamed protein product [Rotaria magnacalcarata]